MRLTLGFYVLLGHVLAVALVVGSRFGVAAGVLVVVGIALLLGGALVLGLCWAASGEPDVNGDPERDAGAPWPPEEHDELQACARAWDRGSAGTAELARNGHPSTNTP